MVKLREESKEEVLDFLREYDSPMLVVTSSLMSGYVSCIKPIRTICGAEIMCNPDTIGSLRTLINSNLQEK